MMRTSTIRSIGLCLGAALWPTAAGAQPAVWTIDAGHSSAQFSVRHMVVSNVKGEFDGPTGTAAFDPADLSTLNVEAAIDARTINTRNRDRDADLRGPLFFDVEKFPRITFKSRGTTVEAVGRLKMTGDLTMHGVTRPVTLEIEGPTPEIKDIWGNRRIGATARTTIDRRDFGLVYNRLLEGGGAVVGNDISISIDLELTRTGTTRPPGGPVSFFKE
jgi:polyisoprenoid-binding protein YceI